MPITETFVQNAVRDRLNKKYYRRKPVYAGTETYTKLRRADVLLAFMRAKNRPYTVVVEAKSRTTIGNLKLKKNAGRQLRYSQVIALALIVGLLLVTGYNWYFNALNTLVLLIAFLVGVGMISKIAGWLDMWFTKSISAIEQLAGYPANESWIAVAADTFVKRADLNSLKKQCRKNGHGLIIVNEKGRLSLPIKPRPRHVFNDYLSEYGKKKKIMEVIGKGRDYGPTPAERARTRRQTFVFLLGLAVVGSVGLLVYEDQYGPVVPDPIVDENWSFQEVYSTDTLVAPTPGLQRQALPAIQTCGAFPVTNRSFIVLDQVASSNYQAAERVKTLRNAGLEAEYLPADCLRSWVNKKRFIVHTNAIYPSRPAAQAAVNEWREALKAKNLPEEFGKVLKVKP
ncbi:hypothetical protein CEQ90_02830 [Lewinellaceae bacterium SD302]|nr:hypothetical protein CEQ90_02830 [Lewinellaceae bacterium SD302]